MTRIYFIDGYLSENDALEHGPHPVGEDDGLGVRADGARTLSEHVDDPVFWVNYPAGTGFFEFLGGEISFLTYQWRFLTNFWSAFQAADETAKRLGQQIHQSSESALVIGKSLGARVALKVREHAPASVIALAPPLSYHKVDWEEFRESDEPAECYFSQNDEMIRRYALISLQWNSCLGIHGVPDHLNDTLRPTDLSPRGHGDLDDWVDILREHSIILEL